MKKQLLRVKQMADQTFLRAEKTEVLTEDLVTAEKRIETIRTSCQTTQKKISSCNIDFGSETSSEKRLKKIPQIALGTSMLENGNSFTKSSVLGDTLRECSSVQTKLGNELLEYYNEVEKTVLKPISCVLDNDVHNINKLRKQLGKLVLDMDSARTRFQTAERHSIQASSNTSLNSMGKIDSLKDELEDASQKVDQCRDALATEMFNLISKEPHLAQLFVHYHKLQADYHRNALAALETSLPILEQQMLDFPLKPVYGCSLEEHLRVTQRDIALVIETCISFLLEYGLLEEGLLRIAGSTSKMKKLKSAFDAGIEIDLTEYVRDPHAVSGALKSYLRELPEPLMTFSLYEEWINAAKIQDFDAKLQALWQVLHKLPDANFKNLQYLIKFLSKLHENVDVNKMTSQNIAIVMAPNVIWSLNEDTSRMNMTTASLHTSIVDTLISYADWFFPDADILPNIKMSNLNESGSSDIMNESLSSDNEINGNTLQTSSLSKDATSSSPHIHHKNIKKPAAPPPPVQRSVTCDKKMISEGIVTGELIDFSGDSLDTCVEPCDSVKSERLGSQLEGENDKSSAASIIRRRSNENFSSTELAHVSKSDKPVIPDKPPTYSSCSLDRRSHRLSSRGDKIPECMVRSHIERPTVPPPERPSKPPKFSSSENISGSNIVKNNEDDVQTSVKCGPVSPVKSNADIQQDGSTTVPTPNVNKADPNLSGLQHSKSSSKVNRFDFLVNQTNEKPPERPPRSTIDHIERTTSILETQFEENLEKDSSKNVPHNNNSPVPNMSSTESLPQLVSSTPPPVSPRSSEIEKIKPPRPSAMLGQIPNSSSLENTSQVVSVPPPVSPRSSEVEKVKPPRPQPPIPAKPKFNPSNENTSL